MLTDEQFGRRLGGQLHSEVEDVHAAPDLVGRVRRRQVRRTRAIGAAIAAPVAIAAVAAILATTGGQGAPAGGHQAGGTRSASGDTVRLQNVGFVKEQTSKALGQASKYVIFSKSTYDGGYYDTWTDPATGRYRNDTYTTIVYRPSSDKKGSVRATAPDPDGIAYGPMHRQQSHAVSGPMDSRRVVSVDYEREHWTVDRDAVPVHRDIPVITDPESIRKAIKDGTVELLGEEKVNGVKALHLRIFGPKRSYRIDMWVDSGTYLPVREIAGKAGKDGVFPASAAVTSMYSWLPRTKENLSLLELTPPAGFTRVK